MSGWAEVMRTTNLVRLSWAVALLEAEGFPTRVLDGAIAALEGGIMAFPRRLEVPAAQGPRARALLDAADPERAHE